MTAPDTGKPGDDYPDLDNPGYIRHCVFPCCKAEYNAIWGAADGRHWHIGNSGPIHGSYICPDHIAIVRDHQPGWITDEEPITGTRCKCGWRWMPEARSSAGEHCEAWKLHVRGQITTTFPSR